MLGTSHISVRLSGSFTGWLIILVKAASVVDVAALQCMHFPPKTPHSQLHTQASIDASIHTLISNYTSILIHTYMHSTSTPMHSTHKYSTRCARPLAKCSPDDLAGGTFMQAVGVDAYTGTSATYRPALPTINSPCCINRVTRPTRRDEDQAPETVHPRP